MGGASKSKAGAETARRGYVAKMPELYKEEKLEEWEEGEIEAQSLGGVG